MRRSVFGPMRGGTGGAYRPGMDTVLTAAERGYLASGRRGCLATIGPDGGPDVVPVSYRLNADGTIDIGGPRTGPFRPGVGRGLELRGRAEALRGVQPPDFGAGLFSDEVIRIHPEQCVSWHVDPARPSLRVLSGHDAVYRAD